MTVAWIGLAGGLVTALLSAASGGHGRPARPGARYAGCTLMHADRRLVDAAEQRASLDVVRRQSSP